ncbi:hypothetical protein CCMSSC00406_0001938 [Pleurotus cornucopiae]|uniref:Uncharacterized protein n=1 Tax=Pleurotus cornucopiae TaxID=5321 RepID=A0ACB7J4M8_PLECO|nr:hypothetical protein CCMSSC00406_0001938 [Pleurotus cornucopiae]
MLVKLANLWITVLAISLSDLVLGRERWLERDNRPVFLYPRRYIEEDNVLNKLLGACPGEVCRDLTAQAVTSLLAAQPECSQQDAADAIIDASNQFDATIQANMIAIAIEYRQTEKNTPPDFSTDPPTLRNSVFCTKAPKNSQLNGLVQAQDPDNDPDLFFDPATQSTVRKGEQPNTFPFGQTDASPPSPATPTEPSFDDFADVFVVNDEPTAETATACATRITVYVGGSLDIQPVGPAVTVTYGDMSASPTPTSTSTPNDDVGNFGTCTTPQIEFGAGFDGRNETSYRPVDKVSFNHKSDQNIDVIIQFICDTLSNLCEGDQRAQSTCVTARAAASAAPKDTGAQADAFNDAFGVPTGFVDIPARDTSGTPIPGTGSVAGSSSSVSLPASTVTSASASAQTTPSSSNSDGLGDFGSCTVPQIEFGAGFDNRRETSFRPVDRISYPQGSAPDVDTVTRTLCNQLINTCGANQVAFATCAAARAAASAAPSRTGAQADAFNAVFGISTNFVLIQALDTRGQPLGSGNTLTSTGRSTSTTRTATSTTSSSTRATATPTPPANNNGSGNNNDDDGNLQTFSGALGGVEAPPVTDAGNGRFQVQGNTFNNRQDALTRSWVISRSPIVGLKETAAEQPQVEK